MDITTCLFIVYRYNSTSRTFTVPYGREILVLVCLLFTDMTAPLEHSQCPLVEMDTITSLFIVYRYNSTTGTFTVPPGREILVLVCLLFTDMTAQPEH